MTLQTAFQSGVVTGRDEKDIPKTTAKQTTYHQKDCICPEMSSIQALARRLYTATEGGFNATEFETENGYGLACTMGGNNDVGIVVLSDADDFTITHSGLQDMQDATFTGPESLQETQETFVKWVGRVLPNHKDAVLNAIHTFTGNGTSLKTAEFV